MNKKFNGVLAVSVLLASSGAHAAEQNVIKKGRILRIEDERFEGYLEELPTDDIILTCGRGKGADGDTYKAEIHCSHGPQKSATLHLELRDAINQYARLKVAYLQQENKVVLETERTSDGSYNAPNWSRVDDKVVALDQTEKDNAQLLQHNPEYDRHTITRSEIMSHVYGRDLISHGTTKESTSYEEFVQTSFLKRLLKVTKQEKKQSHEGTQFVVTHALCRSANGKKPYVSDWNPGDMWEYAGNVKELFPVDVAQFHYDRVEKLYAQQQEQKRLIECAHAGLQNLCLQQQEQKKIAVLQEK